MKIFITLLSLISSASLFSQDDSTGITLLGTNTVRLTRNWGLTLNYDCKSWEKFSEWESQNGANSCDKHDWVYAEWADINTISLITTLEVPPPCGRITYENEARICSKCLLHQKRVKTSGAEQVFRKSKYELLLEQIKK